MSTPLPNGRYRVHIRRGENWPVKLAAETLDGRAVNVEYGFPITADHGGIYAGEHAMYLAREDATPDLAWIASGDLEAIP